MGAQKIKAFEPPSFRNGSQFNSQLSYSALISYGPFLSQVIKYASPTSAGAEAECVGPECTWIEQWYCFESFFV